MKGELSKVRIKLKMLKRSSLKLNRANFYSLRGSNNLSRLSKKLSELFKHTLIKSVLESFFYDDQVRIVELEN